MPATFVLAVTVDAPPDVLVVVSVTEATPLALVSAVLAPPANAPKSGSAEKVTMAFGTTAPLEFLTVAVINAGLLLDMDVLGAKGAVVSVIAMMIVATVTAPARSWCK